MTMPQTEFVAPNLWSLSGGGILVRYWTFTLGPIRQGDEPPHFTYHDSHRTLSLNGNEIRSVNVPDLGTLVSVTIVLTVDTGSTTFSVDRRDNNRARWSIWAALWSRSGKVLHPDSAEGDRRVRCARGRLIAQRTQGIKSSFPIKHRPVWSARRQSSSLQRA